MSEFDKQEQTRAKSIIAQINQLKKLPDYCKKLIADIFKTIYEIDIDKENYK